RRAGSVAVLAEVAIVGRFRQLRRDLAVPNHGAVLAINAQKMQTQLLHSGVLAASIARAAGQKDPPSDGDRTRSAGTGQFDFPEEIVLFEFDRKIAFTAKAIALRPAKAGPIVGKGPTNGDARTEYSEHSHR